MLSPTPHWLSFSPTQYNQQQKNLARIIFTSLGYTTCLRHEYEINIDLVNAGACVKCQVVLSAADNRSSFFVLLTDCTISIIIRGAAQPIYNNNGSGKVGNLLCHAYRGLFRRVRRIVHWYTCHTHYCLNETLIRVKWLDNICIIDTISSFKLPSYVYVWAYTQLVH